MAHMPTRPVDRDKAEQELSLNIKKATSPEETAPKQKHVRSEWSCGAAWSFGRCGGDRLGATETAYRLGATETAYSAD